MQTFHKAPQPLSSERAHVSLCAVRSLLRPVQALRRSPAKKGKTYERPGLSEEEIEEIREAFNLFDTDGSGAVARTVSAVSRVTLRAVCDRCVRCVGFGGVSALGGILELW